MLVLLHVIAITTLAFPAPAGGLDRRTWREPTVQGELQGWRELLASVGWEMDQKTFEDGLYDLASRTMAVREAVIAPMKPYLMYCGAWQSWRMFVAPHMNPARLQVAVGDAEGWHVVFEERSDEYTWRRYMFEQDRMRSAIFRYSWPNYRSGYHDLAEWIARQAAVDFPDATRVRVRFHKVETRSPQAVLAGEEVDGKWVQSWERTLAELRTPEVAP